MAPVHSCTAWRQHPRTHSEQDAGAANPVARADRCFRDQRGPVQHTKRGRMDQSEHARDVDTKRRRRSFLDSVTSMDTPQTSPRKHTREPGELTADVDEFLDVVD